MQRKPGFPVANCSIKMPDCTTLPDLMLPDDDTEQQQRRQQLINFGHSQWGFNNWSWSVSKQELDFVDFSNGKYCAGVVAFVSITVKSFDIHRENIGYATSVANSKGFAIYKSRKCAVTNALRETLMSFGGTVASELCEVLEMHRGDTPANAEHSENNQNVANKPCEPRNVTLERAARNESEPTVHPALRSPLAPPPSSAPPASIAPPACSAPPAVKNAPGARTLPGALPPANRVAPAPRAAPVPAAPAHAPHTPAPAHAPHTPAPAHVPHAPPPHARHNSNVSFVLQPVVGGMVPPLFPPPRVAPPPAGHPVFPNAYYEYPAGGWHFAYESYERPPGNVNVNFNLPPKNLVVNGRGACRQPDDVTYGAPPPAQGCWIKPTIFYDGFWTEQKVKKWVAEQVEKQFPEDASAASHYGTKQYFPSRKWL